jgi:chorismate mutase
MAATTMDAVNDNVADASNAVPGAPSPDAHISSLRSRIDEIDETIIRLWQERAALSQEVGKTRVASGGTRLVLARERQILDRFRADLGEDGIQLALLVLRAGRGPL